jgi:hypothetical protein
MSLRYGLLTIVLAGCSSGAQPPAAPLPLDGSVQIAGEETSAQSHVNFTIAGGYAAPTAMSMAMHDATLWLRSTGTHATIDSLVIPLGDLTVSAEALPPSGLKLRKLSLHLDHALAKIDRASEDELLLSASAPLTLEWSLELDDGSLYPLAPTPTDPMPIYVIAKRAGDQLQVTLTAACNGVCWSDPGVAELSNGSIFLQGTAGLVQ